MGTLLTIVGASVGAALIKLLADDLREAIVWTRKRILRAALRSLPADVRDRFSEEWEADILDKPGEFARLTWVVGCYFATSEIAEIVQSAIVRTFSRTNFDRIATRVMSLVGGLTLAILTGPLILFLSLLKRPLDCHFVLLRKVGREGKAYSQLQYRAKQHTSHVHSFLRFSGLGELPSLANLLKGDMALIGPMPRSREQFDLLRKQHQEIYKRMLPGIASPLVLVDTFRSAREAEDFEFQYFLNRTVISDLCVLWLTVVIVLKQTFPRYRLPTSPGNDL